MATIYFTLKKTPSPPWNEKEVTKYHPVVAQTRTISTKDLAEVISDGTSLTKTDVESVLSALSNVASNYLSRGWSVHLEHLGVLGVSLQGPNIEDFNAKVANEISVKRVTFKADREMVTQLRQSNFNRSNKGRKECPNYSDDEILEMITNYVSNKEFSVFNRREFEQVTGYNRNKSCKTLKRLTEENKLERIGNIQNPMYALKQK